MTQTIQQLGQQAVFMEKGALPKAILQRIGRGVMSFSGATKMLKRTPQFKALPKATFDKVWNQRTFDALRKPASLGGERHPVLGHLQASNPGRFRDDAVKSLREIWNRPDMISPGGGPGRYGTQYGGLSGDQWKYLTSPISISGKVHAERMRFVPKLKVNSPIDDSMYRGPHSPPRTAWSPEVASGSTFQGGHWGGPPDFRNIIQSPLGAANPMKRHELGHFAHSSMVARDPKRLERTLKTMLLRMKATDPEGFARFQRRATPQQVFQPQTQVPLGGPGVVEAPVGSHSWAGRRPGQWAENPVTQNWLDEPIAHYLATRGTGSRGAANLRAATAKNWESPWADKIRAMYGDEGLASAIEHMQRNYHMAGGKLRNVASKVDATGRKLRPATTAPRRDPWPIARQPNVPSGFRKALPYMVGAGGTAGLVGYGLSGGSTSDSVAPQQAPQSQPQQPQPPSTVAPHGYYIDNSGNQVPVTQALLEYWQSNPATDPRRR